MHAPLRIQFLNPCFLKLSLTLWVTSRLLVGKHDSARQLTGVKCSLDPSSIRLVSGSLEPEGGRGQKRKGKVESFSVRAGGAAG